MQHETLESIAGGSVDTWIMLHDGLHADLLRSLLVLQGEYPGDAGEAAAKIPTLVRGLHAARARIPAECRASDPDRLLAASARRSMKNAKTVATPRPRWRMDN